MTAPSPRIETRIRQRIIDAWFAHQQLTGWRRRVDTAAYLLCSAALGVSLLNGWVFGIVAHAMFLVLYVGIDSSTYRDRH